MPSARTCLCCRHTFLTPKGLANHTPHCPVRRELLAQARSDPTAQAPRYNLLQEYRDGKKKDKSVNSDQHQREPEVPPILDLDSEDITVADDDPPNQFEDNDMALSDSVPPLTAAGRPKRTIRRLARFNDFLPHGVGKLIAPDPPPNPPSHVADVTTPQIIPDGASECEANINHLPTSRWRTETNKFGTFREYIKRPTYIPDATGLNPSLVVPIPQSATLDLTSASDPTSTSNPTSTSDLTPAELARLLKEALGPFPNYSTFLHLRWFWTTGSTTISEKASSDLIKNVYRNPRFVNTDVNVPSHRTLKNRVLNWQPDIFKPSKGWQEAQVTISIPLSDRRPEIPRSTDFHVPGLHYRSIVDVVRRVLTTDPNRQSFHLYPFYEYVERQSMNRERVYGELYTSDEFIKEFEAIQKQPPEDNCTLDRIVIALQLWSDATLLTNFGATKLWPVYMALGNQTKYQRSKPNSHAMHDIAHIPSLPEDIEDHVRECRGTLPGAPLLTHCRRELFHAVWEILLDDAFVEAYTHGIVIKFWDGETRRVFLRILTYSADYPEKALIATIRNLGSCPCARCTIKMDSIQSLGLKRDKTDRIKLARKDDKTRREDVNTARQYIYEHRGIVNSKNVEKILSKHSLVPTLNAFSARLGKHGFDYHNMLVVDFLHEVEAGEWKTLLTHLIRILTAQGGGKLNEMNQRYRMIPPFGRDSIRRIGYDVSHLTKLAARDYEDLLQCAIPVFEGLFPAPYDKKISGLLFTFNEWHSLAKLRMHSDTSLKQLESTTRLLGDQLRHFSKSIAPEFATHETGKEAAARRKRTIKNAPKQSIDPKKATTKGPRPVQYHLNRIKLHSLGDYYSQIHRFGSTDSYSTAIGEVRHTEKKRQYKRTSKRQFEKQIASQTTIAENVRIIDEKVSAALRLDKSFVLEQDKTHSQAANLGQTRTRRTKKTLPKTDNNDESLRYFIAGTSYHRANLGTFIGAYGMDRSMKFFHSYLLDHILARLRSKPYAWAGMTIYSPFDHTRIRLENDHIHFHNTLKINFTGYDMQRESDTIKPFLKINPHSISPNNSKRCHIMLSSFEDDGLGESTTTVQFLYAQVMAIIHVMALDLDSLTPKYERLDILWVRWLEADHIHGKRPARQLERISFVANLDDPTAFGFVDPREVIRANHVIPAYTYGQLEETDDSQFDSESFRRTSEAEWKHYYVGWWVHQCQSQCLALTDCGSFADRDMFMRHRGGGVGHLDHAQATNNMEGDASGFDEEMLETNGEGALENESGDHETDSEWIDLNDDEEMLAPACDGLAERNVDLDSEEERVPSSAEDRNSGSDGGHEGSGADEGVPSNEELEDNGTSVSARERNDEPESNVDMDEEERLLSDEDIGKSRRDGSSGDGNSEVDENENESGSNYASSFGSDD